MCDLPLKTDVLKVNLNMYKFYNTIYAVNGYADFQISPKTNLIANINYSYLKRRIFIFGFTFSRVHNKIIKKNDFFFYHDIWTYFPQPAHAPGFDILKTSGVGSAVKFSSVICYL